MRYQKKIRVLSRNDAEKVPIYALSANIFAKDRNKAKDSGMNGYVTKPINYKDLFSPHRKLYTFSIRVTTSPYIHISFSYIIFRISHLFSLQASSIFCNSILLIISFFISLAVFSTSFAFFLQCLIKNSFSLLVALI